MSIETAVVLEEAANVIRRNGWTQDSYVNRDQLEDGLEPATCAMCARGAINFALGGDPENDYFRGVEDAVGAVEVWLESSGVLGEFVSLHEWNDAGSRTAEQVIAALEGAARAEREAAS